MHRLVLSALLLVAASSATAVAQTTSSAQPATAAKPAAPPTCTDPAFTCSDGLCRLEVAFPTEKTCRVRIDDAFIRGHAGSTRITEKTLVRIRIRRPNLLRYAVQFDTKETVVESYVYLEKLWKQVIGLGQLPGASVAMAADVKSAEETFVDAINKWRTALDVELDPGLDGLAQFVGGFTPLTLPPEDVDKIVARLEVNKTRLKALEQLRVDAQSKIKLVPHFALYDATLKTHEEVLGKFDAFAALTAPIKAGLDKKIPFGAAGRIVAVTVSAKDRSTGAEHPQSIDVEFFVHSTLPVTFHAGYTVRMGMKELDFKEVASSLATAGGADLFSKVQDTKVNGTFTAFLSYRICDLNRRGCPQLTIGTDFKDVGERLYGGASWPIGRAFLTLGVVNGETKEGTQPINDVLDLAGQLTDSRELFAAINTKRKWGGFVGISFSPF